MAVEIERKFLVNLDRWNESEKGEKRYYRQGYILMDPEKTVRVRVTDDAGFITIKGKTKGASRQEYEYTIPQGDAIELLEAFCSSDVSKYRYIIKVGKKTWEVDEFLGRNEGLVIAEIELSSEEEDFQMPVWIGKEVTSEEKYYNSNLSTFPYEDWR